MTICWFIHPPVYWIGYTSLEGVRDKFIHFYFFSVGERMRWKR